MREKIRLAGFFITRWRIFMTVIGSDKLFVLAQQAQFLRIFNAPSSTCNSKDIFDAPDNPLIL